MTPEEFNHLSQHVVPVLTDARPYGRYSMVDIDAGGGVQVIVKELMDAGLLNGDVPTCTGETLAEQVARLDTPAAGRRRGAHSAPSPYKPTGGLRLLGGNLSPDYSAILKLAGVEGGLEDNVFKGRARVFEGEAGPAGPRWTRRLRCSRTTTWSSSATRGQAARRACRKCWIQPRASRRSAANKALSSG